MSKNLPNSLKFIIKNIQVIALAGLAIAVVIVWVAALTPESRVEPPNEPQAIAKAAIDTPVPASPTPIIETIPPTATNTDIPPTPTPTATMMSTKSLREKILSSSPSQPLAFDTPTPLPTNTPVPPPTATYTATAEPTPSPTPTATPTSRPLAALSGLLASALNLSVEEPPTPVPARDDRFMLVDQDNQSMHIYEGNTEIRTILVSTGRPVTQAFTPSWQGAVGNYWGGGPFRNSNLFSDNMWYLFPGDGGSILIHSVPYTKDGDQKIYDRPDALGIEPTSHGCVRISPEDAIWLHDWDPVNVPIIITPWSGPITDEPY